MTWNFALQHPHPNTTTTPAFRIASAIRKEGVNFIFPLLLNGGLRRLAAEQGKRPEVYGENLHGLLTMDNPFEFAPVRGVHRPEQPFDFGGFEPMSGHLPDYVDSISVRPMHYTNTDDRYVEITYRQPPEEDRWKSVQFESKWRIADFLGVPREEVCQQVPPALPRVGWYGQPSLPRWKVEILRRAAEAALAAGEEPATNWFAPMFRGKWGPAGQQSFSNDLERIEEIILDAFEPQAVARKAA